MTDIEKTLLCDIKNGNIKSFELVFKSYYPRLCKYAKSMIHDYDASADIVKDVFIRWWQNRLSTLVNTSISGYLYTSVHNGCINYSGRILKNKKTFNESELAIPLSELISPVSTDYPMANLALQELQAAIEKTVNSLPDHCREIFILSRVHHKSHAEIAEMLGISTNTVKVQIYRALLKLKLDLKDYFPIILLIFGNHISLN